MVLWCNWLSLWTLNPTIRVQIPAEPYSYLIVAQLVERGTVMKFIKYFDIDMVFGFDPVLSYGNIKCIQELKFIDIPRSLVRIRPMRYANIFLIRCLSSVIG